MGLRFASQLMVDNLPDEQLTDQFEVIMPELDLLSREANSGWSVNNDHPGYSDFLDRNGFYKYRPIVEEITFGQLKFGNKPNRIRTGWYVVPDDIQQFEDVTISMFCSSAMTAQYYLDAWRDLIFNPEGEYYYPGNHYKKNIDILIYGPGGTGLSAISSLSSVVGEELVPSSHYTLCGCWPASQDTYKLKYENDPQRFRIMATFKVDKVKKDRRVMTAAIRNELLASPTSVLDSALSSFNSSTEYDITNVYK